MVHLDCVRWERTDVLIFPIFASLVWSLAMVWRRRWPSFAIVTAALVLLVGMMRMIDTWNEHLPSMVKIVYELMWPYIGLTGAVGYYICLLPRPFTGVLTCRGCGYDLAGLDPKGLHCPECGAQWRGRGSEFDKPVELVSSPKAPVTKPRATRRVPPGCEVVVIPWPSATARQAAE